MTINNYIRQNKKRLEMTKLAKRKQDITGNDNTSQDKRRHDKRRQN
jgi:hypothetical protein